MENDVLKNKIEPWQEKGRWYKCTIINNQIDTQKTDQFIVDNFEIFISGTAKHLRSKANTDLKILDYIVYHKNTTTTTSACFVTKTFLTDNSKRAGVRYAENPITGELEVFLFIIK